MSLLKDFVPKPGLLPVFVVAPYGPSFVDFLKKLKEEQGIQVVECETSLDAVSGVAQVEKSLLLFHGSDIAVIIKHITMLKLLSREITEKRVRAVVTTKIDQVTLLSKLAFHGCTEVIPEPVTAKGLQFKLQKHIKILQSLKDISSSHSDGLEVNQTYSEGTPSGPGKQDDIQKDTAQFRYTKDLEIDSDFWTNSQKDPVRVAGKWIVELQGPSPLTGGWELEGEASHWVWKPTDLENHPYIREDGRWIFTGQRPEYVKGIWLFVGTKPELAFFQGDEKVAARIFINNFDVLNISRNSEAAKRAQSLNEQSQKRFESERVNPKLPVSIKIEFESDKEAETPVQPQSQSKHRDSTKNYYLNAVQFGKPPGKWLRVERGETDIYVYVPFEILNQMSDAPSIQSLTGYWTYSGTKEPSLLSSDQGKKWVFSLEMPNQLDSFRKLTTEVQEFLKGQFPSQAQAQENTEEPSKEVQAKQEKKSTKVKLGFEFSGNSKLAPLEIETFQPKLNIVLVAILVSDFLSQPGLKWEKVSQYYCQLMSDTFEEVRSELFVRDSHDEAWKSVGTQDGAPSRFEEKLVGFSGIYPVQVDEQTLIIPIQGRKLSHQEDEELVGALVLCGPGAGKISVDAGQQYGLIARGIVQGFYDLQNAAMTPEKVAA